MYIRNINEVFKRLTEPEEITNEEAYFIDQAYMGCLRWCEKDYEGQLYGIERNSSYPAIVSSNRMVFPVKAGTFKKYTQEEFNKLEFYSFGIYHCHIENNKRHIFNVIPRALRATRCAHRGTLERNSSIFLAQKLEIRAAAIAKNLQLSGIFPATDRAGASRALLEYTLQRARAPVPLGPPAARPRVLHPLASRPLQKPAALRNFPCCKHRITKKSDGQYMSIPQSCKVRPQADAANLPPTKRVARSASCSVSPTRTSGNRCSLPS